METKKPRRRLFVRLPNDPPPKKREQGSVGYVPGRAVISPIAVRAFLERKLDDFYYMKQAPREEMLAEIAALGHDWNAGRRGEHRDPWNAQAASFLIGVNMPYFLYLLDMGMGKTDLIVQLIRWRKSQGELVAAIVLVPKRIHIESWLEELKESARDLRCRVLEGTSDEREELLRSKRADIWLSTYDGLMSFMTRLLPNKGKTGGKMKHQIDKRKVDLFVQHFNFMAMDECHEVGKKETLTFRMLNRLAQVCPFRYGMTGTPFGRHPEKLWTQFYLVDHGETLGPNMTMFREAFYEPVQNRIGREVTDTVLGWKFRADMNPKLESMLRHRSIRYEDKEGTDMPQLLRFKKVLNMSAEQRMYYMEAKAKLEAARGDYRSLKNPFIRMRQICAGFTTFKDDENDDRIQVRFQENPKLDALLALALEMPPGSKMMIFHEFTPSGQIIRDAFDQIGLNYASIHKGFKDQRAAYRKFLHDKGCQWFIVNHETGGSGVNPQEVCNYITFWEDPIKTWVKRQAIKRAHRPGQTKRVYCTNLIMRGTVDEDVLEYNHEGINMMDALFKSGPRVIKERQV